MEDRNLELWKANSDILILLELISEIGWNSIREESVQRILYLSKVLFSFIYSDEYNPFNDYHFSSSVTGPFSGLITNSLIDLLSGEKIKEDDEGGLRFVDKNFQFTRNLLTEDWLKTIVYILGLYGESKVFNFTIRDPLYSETMESNSIKELDISPENSTIQVLNEFKEAFENTLNDTSSIDKKEYLELYFEYVFSKIIER